MSFLFDGKFWAVSLVARAVRALGGWETKLGQGGGGYCEDGSEYCVWGAEIRHHKGFIGGDSIIYKQIANAVERRSGGERGGLLENDGTT